MSGFFISLEGGEGTGKSTQSARLAAEFAKTGREVLLTREPGGTPAGEALRNLLVTGDTNRWSAKAEAMLNAAARDVHVRDVIAPALTLGKLVISDRFMDSTRAYQGFAGGCDFDLIDSLERAAVGSCRPQLTLIFDLDPTLGLARAKTRGGGLEDRYERKGLAFHQKLRQGFLAIADSQSERCVVVNANQGVEAVYEEVRKIVTARLYG